MHVEAYTDMFSITASFHLAEPIFTAIKGTVHAGPIPSDFEPVKHQLEADPACQ